MKRESLGKQIRMALKVGPMTTPELRVALNCKRERISSTLSNLLVAGHVGHDGGEPGARRYHLIRESKSDMTDEQRKARRLAQTRAAEERRRRKLGVKPLAEYLADIAKRREERARLKVKAPRPPKVVPPQPKADPKNEWMKAGKGAIRNHLATVDAPANVAHVPTESVEDFLRRGGRIDCLPGPGKVRP